MSKSNPEHRDIPLLTEEITETTPNMDSVRKYLLKTKWDLPIPMIDRLSHHFLLQWDSAYFLDSLIKEAGPGVLTRDGESYNIVLHRCKVEELLTGKVWLSFRKLANYPVSYVLVRPFIYREPIKESNQDG